MNQRWCTFGLSYESTSDSLLKRAVVDHLFERGALRPEFGGLGDGPLGSLLLRSARGAFTRRRREET
eukprot:4495861-Alexandrium_andersonii.AAC.1